MLELVCLALFAVQLVLVAAMVVSWFPVEPGTGLARLAAVLGAVTEPVIGPVRRLAPPVRLGGLRVDVSPLIVLIVVLVVRAYLCA